MSKLTHATANTFKDEVLNSDIPVLVDFYATWCGPCRMIAPALEKLAEEFEGRARIVKVDVDEEYPLANRYGIMGVPTLMLFSGGDLLDTADSRVRIVGFVQPDLLRAKLKKAAAKSAARIAA